jgi:hypothetical protein
MTALRALFAAILARFARVGRERRREIAEFNAMMDDPRRRT